MEKKNSATKQTRGNALTATKTQPFDQIVIFCIAISVIWLILSCFLFHGDTLASFVFSPFEGYNVTDAFMDFFNSIRDSIGGTPYTNKCIYPPLAYAFYNFMYLFFPSNFIGHTGHDLRYSQSGLLLVIAYTFVTSICAFFLCYWLKSGTTKRRALFALFIVLSNPFLFAFERANLILMSFLFLMGYFLLKDSKSRVLREISYICLAVSAAFKIYPAVFGLLLIFEKRWDDAIRCVIWGVVLFFVPFVFFEGLTGFRLLLHNIVSAGDLFLQINTSYKLNYSNTLATLLTMAGMPGVALEPYLQMLSFLMGFTMMIASFFHKTKWKSTAILALIVVGVPNFSFVYTLIFMTIPLIYFLDDQSKRTTLDRIYLICFIGLFVTVAYPYPDPQMVLHVNYFIWGIFIKGFCLLLMAVLLTAEPFVSVCLAWRFYSKKLRRVLACLATILVAVILVVGMKFCTIVYASVSSHYVEPITLLASENNIKVDQINLFLSKAKWVNSMMGLHPKNIVQTPELWGSNTNYTKAMNVLNKDIKPFIVYDDTIDFLSKNQHFWEDISKNYLLKDKANHLMLFVPRDSQSSTAPTITIEYIDGFDPQNSDNPSGPLASEQHARIRVTNNSNKAIKVNLKTDITLFDEQDDMGEAQLAELKIYQAKVRSQGIYDIKQNKKDVVSVVFDGESHMYQSDESHHVSILQDIVLSPGYNMVELHTDDGYAGDDEDGFTAAMVVSPVTVQVEADSYKGVATALKNNHTSFYDTVNIVKYPNLFLDEKGASFIDSYFDGPINTQDMLGQIKHAKHGVVLDSYTIKYFNVHCKDLFWQAMRNQSLKYFDDDFYYFEPLNKQNVSVDYHNLFVVDSPDAILTNDGSLYYQSNNNYLNIINPFGVPVNTDISFDVKCYAKEDSLLYIESGDISSDITLKRSKEHTFNQSLTLNPGVNYLHLYTDTRSISEDPGFELFHQMGAVIYFDSPNSFFAPDYRLDEYDKTNLEASLSLDDLLNAYYRIHDIRFNNCTPAIEWNRSVKLPSVTHKN